MKKSFTLIELLIVVLIVGILATVALPQYTKVIERTRSVEPVTLMSAIKKAEILYYLEFSRYTGNVWSLDIEFPFLQQTAQGRESDHWIYTMEASQIIGAPMQHYVRATAKSGAGYIRYHINSDTWNGTHSGVPQ